MSKSRLDDELLFCGRRLKAERKRIGLTQTEFGKLTGVSLNSQTRFEMGKCSFTVAYLLKSAAHGVDISYVLTGYRGGNADDETRHLIGALGQLNARERGAVLALVLGLLGRTPGNFQ